MFSYLVHLEADETIEVKAENAHDAKLTALAIAKNFSGCALTWRASIGHVMESNEDD